MALAKEDIEYIKQHMGEWLAELSLGKPPAVYELELRERMVRVEEELKHQRELMRDGFDAMNARFEAMQAQVDKRFEQVDKRLEQVDKRLDSMRADGQTLRAGGQTLRGNEPAYGLVHALVLRYHRCGRRDHYRGAQISRLTLIGRTSSHF